MVGKKEYKKEEGCTSSPHPRGSMEVSRWESRGRGCCRCREGGGGKVEGWGRSREREDDREDQGG